MIRDTLSSLLSGPAARAVESPVREMVEEILASRSFAAPADVDALRRELEALRAGSGDETAVKITALEQEVASLKKKLSMSMGALQAATAQIADAKRAAEEALGTAKKATQQATSALATADSAAQGARELVSAPVAAKAPKATKATKATRPAAPPTEADPEHCTVPGCSNQHRARGYCAKHYQQWKRGTLEA